MATILIGRITELPPEFRASSAHLFDPVTGETLKVYWPPRKMETSLSRGGVTYYLVSPAEADKAKPPAPPPPEPPPPPDPLLVAALELQAAARTALDAALEAYLTTPSTATLDAVTSAMTQHNYSNLLVNLRKAA